MFIIFSSQVGEFSMICSSQVYGCSFPFMHCIVSVTYLYSVVPSHLLGGQGLGLFDVALFLISSGRSGKQYISLQCSSFIFSNICEQEHPRYSGFLSIIGSFSYGFVSGQLSCVSNIPSPSLSRFVLARLCEEIINRISIVLTA